MKIRRVITIALSAALCVLTAQAGTWVTGSHTNQYGTRDYELYVPTGYVAGQDVPLLVGLHGCTQTPALFAGLTGIAGLADTHNVLVLLPAQSVLSNSMLCWNWFLAEHQKRDQGEPSIVRGMIDQVKNAYSVDESRTYVFGMSAGGFMTGTMLACYSDVFAAGMMSAGGMYEAGTDLVSGVSAQRNGSTADPNVNGYRAWQCGGSPQPRPMPLLVVHGTGDGSVVPLNAQQALDQFAQTNDYSDDGLDNDSVDNVVDATTAGTVPGLGGLTYTRKDYIQGSTTLMQFYLVNGMGHKWSGGSLLYVWGEPKGPDATKLLWEFVSQHTR